MESYSDWYNRTTKEISLNKDTLNKKTHKKYKVDLLLRLAKRVEDFSYICGECQLFQPEISKLTQDLNYLLQMPNPSKEASKSYFKAIDNMVKHLQKKHKLVKEGHYLGIGIGIGMALSAGIGTVLGNPGIGPAAGIAIGVAIGIYLDKKAKQEGRVI